MYSLRSMQVHVYTQVLVITLFLSVIAHVHDRKFCKFYMRNQKCYRGDQCPYEHPKPGNV